MNKTQLIGLIKSRIASLDALIKKLDQAIAGGIEGHLILSSMRGVTRFYHVREKDGVRSKVYLTDMKKKEALAAKLYNCKLRSAALKELGQLKQSLYRLQIKTPDSDIEKVYDSLPEAVKAFVKPSAATGKGFAQAWQSEKVICARKTSAHTVKTLRGDFVRSKSEALIADRFYSLGIPYRYEQRFTVDDLVGVYLHPDFRVLNKRTGAEFIWEHCGMMDDPKYSSDALDRLAIFSSKGYFQGKNLIFTYETRERPLNLEYVDRLIREFLL